jgi:pimeloyl-ACP methyl ester carboxylesterase
MAKLNRNGARIHYEVHGSGPPLILTHGYSATAQMWKGQIEPLSKKHTLILRDMRGHGQSERVGLSEKVEEPGGHGSTSSPGTAWR